MMKVINHGKSQIVKVDGSTTDEPSFAMVMQHATGTHIFGQFSLETLKNCLGQLGYEIKQKKEKKELRYKGMTLKEFEELFNQRFISENVFLHDADYQVNEDLKGVIFDFENVSIDQSYQNMPVGFQVLENGMPCVFVNTGGDWEHPICYIIYHDGNSFRAYIPKRGNVWNRITNTAFGSEQEVTENSEEKFIEGVELLLNEQRLIMKPEDVGYFELNIKNSSTTEIDTDLYKFANPTDIFLEIMDTIKNT